MTFAPLIDVTIAVHSASRPIARAVHSVLAHTAAPVRVNVVAHNIDPQVIAANLGDYAADERVRLLSLADGIHSPAGPMNHGFAASTADFLCLMGSDDELAPGALDSWLALQRETGADAVLARIQLADGRPDPYPPVRAGRRFRELDPVKDRLAYRSAPLGLISRKRFGQLRLSVGLPSGEDLPYSLALWFTGKHLAYDFHGPAYVINDDATDRVTYQPRPLAEDFAFLDEITEAAWFRGAGRAARIAIVSKLIRIHFFDAVLTRTRTAEDLAANRADLVQLVARFAALAPGVLGVLARTDATVIRALKDPASTPETILTGLEARLKYLAPATLIAANPLKMLHRQAPLRTLFAGFRLLNSQVAKS